MRFRDIPQFISGGNYACDVGWDYLEAWLADHDRAVTLDLDPDFQRGHVWNDAKRVAYVEYILRGGQSSYDIWWNCPTWASIGRGTAPLTIVDGKQRLEAVRKFMRGDLRIFAGLRGCTAGYLVTDFTDRLGIAGPRLRMHVNNLESRKLVLQWYLDLNGGGVVHTDEELARVRALLAAEDP